VTNQNLLLEIQVGKWEDAVALARRLPACVVFRGQENKCWRLQTTHERLRKTYPDALGPDWLIEYQILEEFQRNAARFLSTFPRERPLDWLAIVQHHGGPTRLLDFTYSFYVAAFFAFEHATKDAAIWIVNQQKLEMGATAILDPSINQINPKVITPPPSDIELGRRLRKQFDSWWFNQENAPVAVVPLEPHELTDRPAIQQGLFLAPTSTKTSFEQALAATFAKDAKNFDTPSVIRHESTKIEETLQLIGTHDVIKVVVPRSAHKPALIDLRSMNVTAASLFPGLDGYARSLSFKYRMAEESRGPVEVVQELFKLAPGP